MIKFAGKLDDGRPLYGFGISAANWAKLLKGKPIKIDLAEMGGSGIVLIIGGETEEQMADAMRPMTGPDTTIKTQEHPHPGP